MEGEHGIRGTIFIIGCLVSVKSTYGAIAPSTSMEEETLTIDLSMGLDLGKNLLEEGLRPQRDISDHLDEDLKPIRPKPLLRNGKQDIPDDIPLPADGIIPEGFDLSTAEEQDDGQFCVYKTIPIEGIEKMPVQQCVHKEDRQCYDTFVTQYTPTTEDVCS